MPHLDYCQALSQTPTAGDFCCLFESDLRLAMEDTIAELYTAVSQSSKLLKVKHDELWLRSQQSRKYPPYAVLLHTQEEAMSKMTLKFSAEKFSLAVTRA